MGRVTWLATGLLVVLEFVDQVAGLADTELVGALEPIAIVEQLVQIDLAAGSDGSDGPDLADGGWSFRAVRVGCAGAI